jgi:hypothetical protein
MSDHIQEKLSVIEHVRLAAGDDSLPPDIVRRSALTWEEPPAMDVFVAWEKLRLVYNLILMAVVLALANPLGLLIGLPLLLPFLLEGALSANICFCAGPVVEGYLCLLGVKRHLSRGIAFVTGTLVAIGLTWYALKVYLPVMFPDK